MFMLALKFQVGVVMLDFGYFVVLEALRKKPKTLFMLLACFLEFLGFISAEAYLKNVFGGIFCLLQAHLVVVFR